MMMLKAFTGDQMLSMYPCVCVCETNICNHGNSTDITYKFETIVTANRSTDE